MCFECLLCTGPNISVSQLLTDAELSEVWGHRTDVVMTAGDGGSGQ